MTPTELKDLVDETTAAFNVIQNREFDEVSGNYRQSMTAMWVEASQIAPTEWREIVRVLAQGGDYYGITWGAT
jgi:hypothetical protein